MQGTKVDPEVKPGNPGTQTSPRLARGGSRVLPPRDSGATKGCLILSFPLHQTSQRLTAPVSAVLPTLVRKRAF